MALMGVLLLALLVRLAQLEAQSIWWDEAISIHLATSGLRELLADRAAHVHPPLYFVLLKAWVRLAGVSAFAVRFFSVWFNVLLVPAAYAFGSRQFDRRVGLVSAILVASSPLYIIYAQEARVYALLPLFYVALLILTGRLRSRGAPQPWLDWALLSIAEVIGLYLHYVFLFAVIYTRLLLVLDARRRRYRLRRWLASLMAVVLACLPWAIAVLFNWRSVLSDIGSGDPLVEPAPLDHLVRLLWSFQWSGLTGAPGYQLLRLTTFVLAGLLLVALFFLLGRSRGHRVVLGTLSHWLLPLAASLSVWLAKPLSHPRYVVPFTVGLFFFCAYALVRLARGSYLERGLALLIVLAILSCTAISLRAYAFDDDFAKDDVRAVASWLEERATERDLIIAPWRDWSLDYAYHGAAPIVRPNPAEAEAVWSTLVEQALVPGRVFLVAYPDAPQDRRKLLRFALETRGSLVENRSFADIDVYVYRLNQVPTQPRLFPADARFGPLHLIGMWVERGAPANTAVGVALRWQLEEPIDSRLRANLDVRSPSGWTWATSDDWLLGRTSALTDRWREGEEVTTYHILPLPLGTPPVTYTLSLGVYETQDDAVEAWELLDEAGNPKGQSHELETFSLAPPVREGEDPYGVKPQAPAWEEPVDLGGGLLLVGASLNRESVAPGESIFVSLRWQSSKEVEVGRTASLALRQARRVLSDTAEIGGRYPAPRWSVGQTVVEHRRFPLPGTVDSGPADVILDVDDRQVTLGTLEIAASEHRFEPPPISHKMDVAFDGVAELLGYDLVPGPYKATQPITVTLYWRALEGASNADYKVFAHLLDDSGRLIGQHDGRPVGGRRPSQGWVAGEILVDRHPMALRAPHAGPAAIEVGLYRSDNLERVPAEGGGNAVLLPTSLVIQEP